MINEQNLIITSVLAIVAVGILTKIRIIPQKYFQTLFNIIFFAYVYLCFQYDYMDIMKAGAVVYGGIILVCWVLEMKNKKH